MRAVGEVSAVSKTSSELVVLAGVSKPPVIAACLGGCHSSGVATIVRPGVGRGQTDTTTPGGEGAGGLQVGRHNLHTAQPTVNDRNISEDKMVPNCIIEGR